MQAGSLRHPLGTQTANQVDCNQDCVRDNGVEALITLLELCRMSSTTQPSTTESSDAPHGTVPCEDPKLTQLKMKRHSRILEHLVRGDSLETVLTMLVELAEETREGMLGSIMLVDSQTQQLRHAASVSLPPEYIEAINGLQIGPNVGSCGTAAFSGERVIVADVQTHPDWTEYQDVVRAAGLRACWSEPIVSGKGELLGTFGMYYRETRHPETSDLEFVLECATLSALAIERHRDEQRTRQTAAIVDSSDEAIISKDVDGIIQSWNPAAERIFGYSADEVIGRSITMLIPKDRLAELNAYQSRLRNGERIEHFETVRLAKDGTRIDVVLTLSPVHDADGKIVQFVDVQRNITSSKRDQADLHETRRQHSMLLSNLLGAAFRCRNDEVFSVEMISDGIESVLGYTPSQLISKQVDWLSTVEPSDRENLRSEMQLAFNEKESYQSEFRIRHRDGSIRWLWEQGRGIYDDDGNVVAFEGYVTDITELQVVQDRLIQSERLAALGQMISVIAHESRNALQRIQVGVDMLGFEMAEDSDSWKDLQRISRAKEDLHHLYEELRSYAAPMKLECNVCSVGQIWRQAWSSLESARAGREVRLIEQSCNVSFQLANGAEANTERKLEAYATDLDCEVDAFRLEQVFRNLFENSLAACDAPVEICIGCNETTIQGGPALSVQVCDNGPGLSGEQKTHVFDAFFTTKQKGTGLGMAIAQRILSAHFGTIAAGNGESGGACIELCIPRTQP